ncbi:MAG TPA: lysoplasmalogenase [Polyangiaceae bacterium]
MIRALLIALCAMAVGGLLHAEKTRQLRLKYACKPVASLAFVALGTANLWRSDAPTTLDVCLCVGLVLGAVGDVCLMLPGARWFLAGLIGFLLGHVAYAAGFFGAAPPSTALVLPALSGALLVVALLWRWWRHLGSKRFPVVAYAGTIVMMVTAAWGLARAGTDRGWWCFVAATLFALSDVAVLRERFVERSFANKAWGLPTYYAAQLLLAASIG